MGVGLRPRQSMYAVDILGAFLTPSWPPSITHLIHFLYSVADNASYWDDGGPDGEALPFDPQFTDEVGNPRHDGVVLRAWVHRHHLVLRLHRNPDQGFLRSVAPFHREDFAHVLRRKFFLNTMCALNPHHWWWCRAHDLREVDTAQPLFTAHPFHRLGLRTVPGLASCYAQEQSPLYTLFPKRLARPEALFGLPAAPEWACFGAGPTNPHRLPWRDLPLPPDPSGLPELPLPEPDQGLAWGLGLGLNPATCVAALHRFHAALRLGGRSVGRATMLAFDAIAQAVRGGAPHDPAVWDAHTGRPVHRHGVLHFLPHLMVLAGQLRTTGLPDLVARWPELRGLVQDQDLEAWSEDLNPHHWWLSSWHDQAPHPSGLPDDEWARYGLLVKPTPGLHAEAELLTRWQAFRHDPDLAAKLQQGPPYPW